jgi:hypothetical protein
VVNLSQTDADNDGLGDACDTPTNGEDSQDGDSDDGTDDDDADDDDADDDSGGDDAGGDQDNADDDENGDADNDDDSNDNVDDDAGSPVNNTVMCGPMSAASLMLAMISMFMLRTLPRRRRYSLRSQDG